MQMHACIAQRAGQEGKIDRTVIGTTVLSTPSPRSGAWALLTVSYATEIDRGSVLSVTWSPDGKILASGSGDETIMLWSAETGQCLKTLAGHE